MKSSRYKGVHFDKRNGWMATAVIDGKKTTRGPFADEQMAVQARVLLLNTYKESGENLTTGQLRAVASAEQAAVPGMGARQ